MLTKKIYPKCALTFKKILNTNPDFSKFYYFLGEPKPFDVTLRDGLQSLPREYQDKITIVEKLNLYHEIMFNFNPKNIEIGSLVSEKVLPIFKDSINVFNNIQLYEMNMRELNATFKTNKFLLVPNSNQL